MVTIKAIARNEIDGEDPLYTANAGPTDARETKDTRRNHFSWGDWREMKENDTRDVWNF
jgi:hypothetical protein